MFNRNYIIAYPGGVRLKSANNKTAEIDLSQDKLYIVKNGRLIAVDPPGTGYGEQTAIWKDGKVLDVINTERIRIQ